MATGLVGCALVAVGLLAALLVRGPVGDGPEAGAVAARLVEPPVPDGSWGLDWGDDVRHPAAEQAAQLRSLRDVAGGASALVALLAGMVAVGLLRQRDRLRRAEVRVHRAVGAQSIHRVARLAGAGWRWAVAFVFFGLVVGVGIPRIVAGTFPGPAQVPQNVAASLIAVTALLVLAVRWEGGAGRRSVRGDGFWATVVSSPVAVATVGFAALTGVGLLARHTPGLSDSPVSDHAPRVVGSVALTEVSPARRGAALAAWSRRARAGATEPRVGVAGAEVGLAGSGVGLASAGAARGTGHGARIHVQCGDCWEGGLPMPLKVVQAEVHAVAEDTFPRLGLTVVDGRDFDDQRDIGDPAVAIVSRALAVRHFEDGAPLGRKLRVGDSPWLTVVGVVSDAPDVRDPTEYAVYLPVTQATPAHVELLASSEVALEPWLTTAPEEAVSTVQTRAELFAVQGWFARVLRTVGVVASLLVAVGVWLGSRHEARATVFELALHRAVGARRRDLHARFFVSWGRRLALALVAGAWLSLFLGAGLEGAFAGIPQVDPGVWLRVGLVIAVPWLVGAWPSVRRAARISPVEGLRAAR